MTTSPLHRAAGMLLTEYLTCLAAKSLLLIMTNSAYLLRLPPHSCAQIFSITFAAGTCRLCNRDIVARVQQVICFAFHDSNLLLETCNEAKETRKFVTLFYLD